MRSFRIIAEGFPKRAYGAGFPLLIIASPARQAKLRMAGGKSAAPLSKSAVVKISFLRERGQRKERVGMQPGPLPKALGMIKGRVKIARLLIAVQFMPVFGEIGRAHV